MRIAIGISVKLAVETSLDGEIEWSSSNKKVAKVASSGKVTAVGEGICYVTAQKGDYVAKCKVYVYSDDILATDFVASGDIFSFTDGIDIRDQYEYLTKSNSAKSWLIISVGEKDYLACEDADVIKTKRGAVFGIKKDELKRVYGKKYTETAVSSKTDGICHVASLYENSDNFRNAVFEDFKKATSCVFYSYERDSSIQIRFYFDKKDKLIGIAYVKGYSDSSFLAINSFFQY